jgi:uncharacterized short protein YbdD (DUF466 family)
MINVEEGGSRVEGRGSRPTARPASIRAHLSRALDVVRRIVGVPDYDRYVAHMRTHHPEQTPLTCEEFTNQRMIDKYSRPGSRCC